MISKHFIKDFLTYSAGSVITQVCNILLIVFLMYHVPAQQVGLFSLATSAILLISTLISLGMRQLFMLEFFTLSSRHKKEFVNDIVTLYLILLTIAGVIAFFGYTTINNYLFASSATPILYLFIILQAFLTFFTELFYQALMYTMQSLQVTIIKTAVALFVLLACIISIYYFKGGVQSILIAQCASYIALTIYAYRHYHAYQMHEYFNPARTYLKSISLLTRSAPLVPTVIAGIVLASGNRWILSLKTDLADVALYSLAEYVAPLFNLIILYPLSGAYLPRIMALFNEKPHTLLQTDQENKRLMWLSMLLLFVLGTCGYFCIKPFIFYFLPKNYYAAIGGAYAIFLGNLFLMGTYFTSSILIYRKKSYRLLLAIALAALFNITLSYFLVPIYGINGCFFSYLFAYALYFALIYYFNRTEVLLSTTRGQ